MNDSRSQDQTALVTGASDRLGAAFTRALAAAGYRVVIHYRTSAEKAQALAGEINSSGGQAGIVQGDLTDRGKRAGLIAKAACVFGPLSVLINNASLFVKDSPDTLDEAVWDAHMAIHGEAPIFLSRNFVAQVPKGQTGNIINILDERVLRPAPAAFSYNISKSILWTATQTMAQSFAPQVRVNAIGPGPILPEANQSQAAFDARSKKSLLGRSARPDDAVRTLLFLLASETITGQFLAVDGGEHLSWPDRRGPTPRQK